MSLNERTHEMKLFQTQKAAISVKVGEVPLT